MGGARPCTAERLVDIRLLGPLEVAVGERDIAIGSPKQRVVLAMLALAGRASVDALAEALWPAAAPASVAATVQTLVSRLRRAVESTGGALPIRAEAGHYVLDDGACHLDTVRFQALVADGCRARRAGAPDEAARYFREAQSLWRGPALADLADHDFARIAAVRLDAARVDLAEELAEAELAAGQPVAALAAVEQLVAAHPFRERLRELQMLALYRLGRQAEALAAYQDLRRTLAEDLGLEPSPPLRRLEGAILRQSPDLDGLSTPGSGPPASATAGAARAVEPAPGGTLAFLFTDIEGSTRRWEGDRTAMARDLAQHDTILRAAIAGNGGQLFTHTGDGLGAVFPTVPAALATAMAGQAELLRAAWSGSPPLRVRMAVHAGTAEARAGTFLGPTLNRTARLLSEATGGQILCSQAAADLARDELPAGARLLDRGERNLAGLSRPERIWQVQHPDLPAPPASGSERDARRPGVFTPLVGREAELLELAELLSGVRLLTITGCGGAGKTRLALETAQRAGGAFAHGVCLVELASITDGRPLASVLLGALDVEADGAGGGAAEEQLCRILGERQLLVVLDNCEHVVGSAAALADLVLRRCPGVKLLATSREVLSVAGETVWATPPLSLPPEDVSGPDDLAGSDAAALFIARARTAQPAFGAVAANAAAIGRICRALDGIPLALELAAARVRVLSAPQLADRLDDRLRLLTSGPRSAPARHQTLRAAMDWSFELLSEPERRLLRRLSVCPQDFDLEAAAAVADEDADPIDVLDLLACLVDKSLLVPSGAAETTRFRLLETIRQYSAEKLAEVGETDATLARHRRHFAGRIIAAFGAGVRFFSYDWGRQAVREREHFHAALVSALADGDMETATVVIAGLGFAWWWGGVPVPPALAGVEVDRLSCSSPSLLVEALMSLAMGGLAAGRWDVESAAAAYEVALAVADRSGTPDDRGFVRYYLGYWDGVRGNRAAARRWLQEALDLLEPNGTGRVVTDIELGWLELSDGNAGAAARYFADGLAILGEGSGWEVQAAHLAAGLALSEAIEGDIGGALAHAGQAIAEARHMGLEGIVIMALVRAGEVAAVAETTPGPELAELLSLLRSRGGLRWVSATLVVAAVAHEAAGRPEVAGRLLGGAAGVAAAIGEELLPFPAMAAVVAGVRRRLSDSLGEAALAETEEAGRRMAAPALLDLALDSLEPS